MFPISELVRKVKNIIRITTVISTKSKDGKALATVRVGSSDESVEFPVLNFGNSFKKHWIPVREDEQVLVFHPFGNANKGYILRAVFSKKIREIERSNIDVEVMEFEDKSNLSYNSDISVFKIDVYGDMSIVCDKNLKIKADKVIVTSGNFTIDGAGDMTTKGTATDGNSCNLNKHQHCIRTTCTSSCSSIGKTVSIVPCTEKGFLLKSGHGSDSKDGDENSGSDVAGNRVGEGSPVGLSCDSGYDGSNLDSDSNSSLSNDSKMKHINVYDKCCLES